MLEAKRVGEKFGSSSLKKVQRLTEYKSPCRRSQCFQSVTTLFQSRVGERLTVGGNDVDAVRVAAGVEQLPHDFFFAIHLKNTHFGGVSLSVAANDGIAIGQPLTTARIGESASNVRVVHAPDDFAFRVKLHRLVAVREVDNCVTVDQANRGERPVLGSTPAASFLARSSRSAWHVGCAHRSHQSLRS